MYDQFYALKGRPFQLTPDPHFYFESGTHRKALSYLGYGLAQGEGFIVRRAKDCARCRSSMRRRGFRCPLSRSCGC